MIYERLRRWYPTNGLQQPVRPVQLSGCGVVLAVDVVVDMAANPRRRICGGMAVMFAGHNQNVLSSGDQGHDGVFGRV